MKIKTRFHKLTAWLLTLAMLMTFIPSFTLTASAADGTDGNVYEQMLEFIVPENNYGIGDIHENRIFHAWGWSYQNIKTRLETIAEQGFSTILVSPPNEIKMPTKYVKFHEPEIDGISPNGWWMLYQPAGFQINESGDNALGTKSKFVELCEDAHDLGLKIMVEAVVGYVGSDDDHVGEYDNESNKPMDHVSSRVAEFEPELLADEEVLHFPWVNCTYKDNYRDGYSDYDIEEDLTQHAVDGKPDLATEKQLVQDAIFDYFVELVEAGADGFYFNDAKHIETASDTYFPSDFWEDTLSKIREHYPAKNLQAVAELIGGSGDGRSAEEYLQYGMNLTNTTMSDTIRDSVVNGTDITDAFDDAFPQENSVLWGESYKSYANGETSALTSEQRAKTWALTVSRKGVKGIYLARPSDTLAEGKSEVNSILSTITLGEGNVTDWSTDVIKRINNFAGFFEDTDENVHYDNGIAVIERDGKGAVLVNMQGKETAISLSENSLIDGEYTDAVTENKFTVENGKITGEIGESGIAVLYLSEDISIFNLRVGGEQVTSRNLVIDENDNSDITSGSATYDTHSNTLTLNNFTYSGDEDTNNVICYTSSDDLKLVIEGTNSIICTNDRLLVVDVLSNMEISGNGSLSITGGDYGMNVMGSMTVTSGSLSANGGNYGVNTMSGITVSGGSLSATGGRYGVNTISGITVSGGSLSANGGSIGVNTLGEITISGGETVAKGATNAFSKAPTISDTFNNAVVWYGESEDAANEAGAKDISELADNYNQKYIKVAEDAVVPVHSITVTTPEHGTVTADKLTASEGETVTLTVTPAENYDIDTVTYNDGISDVEITATGGVYSFIMPASDVAVTTELKKKTYTVTFVDFDYTELKSETVEHGKAATAPANPTREGYTFTGWDKAFDNVTSDLTVKAVYLENINYIDANGANQTCTDYTLVTSDMTNWNSGWYVIKGDVNIRGTVTVNVSEDVRLILCDGASLNAYGIYREGRPGIKVEGNLTIYGQSGGTGELYAIGGYSTGGNGDGIYIYEGAFTIIGGIVTAKGDIGGSSVSGSNGIFASGSTVTVSGGKLTATGRNGAGGGNGIYAYESFLNITGGTVITTGGYGGDWGNGEGINALRSNIIVSGGNITANGPDYGIENKFSTVLEISGGKLTATGDKSALRNAPVMNGIFTVTVKDANGTVVGYDPEAIDSYKSFTAEPGTSYKVNIDSTSGGTVTATPNEQGAGWKVTVSVTPNEGYSLTVLRIGDEDIKDELVNGKYSFTIVDSDTTITAEFVPNKHDIIYMVDDVEYERIEDVEYGTAIALITEPTKTGYTFSGWQNAPATMPDEDVAVTGTFSINQYSIIYMVDDTEYAKITRNYGENVFAVISNPTKTGYTFSGWSQSMPNTMPAENVTITARWTLGTPTVSDVSGYSGEYDGVSHEISVIVDVVPDVDYSYQWYKDGKEEANKISGATSAEYTVKDVADSGTYYCKVTASDGTQAQTVWSDNVDVTIAKKSIEAATVALDGALTYTGAEQTQNVTVTLDGFTVTFDVTDNKATNIKTDGNYTLKVTANGNFVGEKTLEWNIAKADHIIEGENIPTASRIRRGNKLSDSTITPAELKDADGNVLGAFTWVTPDDEMTETGDFVKQVKFTPVDTTNYNEKTFDVTVNVYRPSSGGGGSSNTSTTTTKNEDGSTTKVTENKTTGTKTEVTTNTDGSTTTVETKKDGTVTTTEKDKDGNTTTTVEKSDGTSTTTEKNKDGSEKVTEKSADGTTVTTEKDTDGTKAVTTEKADGSTTTEETKKDGTKVTTETTADGETKTEIDLPKDKETEVTIPAPNAEDVTSVTVTDKDGKETEITDFEITEDGVKLTVSGDCTAVINQAAKKEFVDVHPVNHWATADIDYAYTKDLMMGTSENHFSPDVPLTRAMLVTVLYRLEGEPATNKSIPFADVDMGTYYGNAVSWAKQNGIVNGVSETEFTPDDNITREQIAAIMHRYAQYKDYDVTVGENTNILSYDDFDDISEYAIVSMQWAVGSGLIKGKSEITLNSLDNATRAEVAAILHRFIEANKK